METLVINIPDKKIALVKELLKELGVSINEVSKNAGAKKTKSPNALTIKTIENAHQGIGLSEPISDISSYIKQL